MADRRLFIQPHFHGKRFDQHDMPLEVLQGLSALRDLVIEVAKSLFHQKYPRRGSLPKGFSQKLELFVKIIEDGCAAPRVDRKHPSRMFAGTHRDIFDDALVLTLDAVRAANDNKPLPVTFPIEQLWRFSSITQNLEDDDYIDLAAPDSPSTHARLDQTTARHLTLLRNKFYTKLVRKTGRINQPDINAYRFMLRVEDEGMTVAVELQGDERAAYVGTIKTAGVLVEVAGVGTFDARDRLVKINTITELTRLSDALEPDVDSRLVDLRELEDGWLDGQGSAPPAGAIDRLERILEEMLSEYRLRTPYLYPTPEGGIQAEWPFEQFEVSAAFDFEADEVYLHVASSRGRFSEEKTVAIGDLDKIAEFVQRFGGGPVDA